MDQTNNNQAKALLEVWEVLLRFRWRFILPAFLVTSAVLAVSMVMPRKYHAEAIFERSNDMVLTEITHRGASQSFQDPRQAMMEELAGSPAIELLRRRLDPILQQRAHSSRLLDLNDFYENLSRRVVVRYASTSKQHDRIRVEYVGNDAVLSRLVVNTLVDNYIQRTRSQMESRLRNSAQFFSDEVRVALAEIEQMENQKLKFEIEHVSLLPDNPNSIQMMLAEKQTLLTETAQQRDNTVAEVQALEQELVNTPQTLPQVFTGRNPELQRIEKRLREARSLLADYLGRFKMTDKHPDIINLREQIASMEQEAAGTEQEVITQKQILQNPKRAELETRLAIARSYAGSMTVQAKSLKQEVARLNTEAADLFPIRSQYNKISRAVEEAQRQLTFWEGNLRRVNMALTAQSDNRGVILDFIKPCSVIRKPVSPNLGQVLMVAVALGLMAGSMSVFFAHRTDETFTDGDQLVDAFKLPMFGTVSEIISQRQRRARRMRNLIIYPVNAAVMAAVLLGMTTLLYLNLERPTTYDQLKKSPAAFLRDQSGQSDSEPTAATQD